MPVRERVILAATRRLRQKHRVMAHDDCIATLRSEFELQTQLTLLAPTPEAAGGYGLIGAIGPMGAIGVVLSAGALWTGAV